VRIGVVMDPISKIKTYKDSTFAMLLQADQRNWPIYYMEQKDLFIKEGRTWAKWQKIRVFDRKADWFSVLDSGESPLDELIDALLMRKDPPFDMEYIYTTYMMELAESRGVLMVNKPQSLRDANEKLFTTFFPQCCVPSLISRSMDDIRQFIELHKDVIVKPLDLMGGASIFRLQPSDQNLSVILENMTQFETRTIMAQTFIPEITEGDKRILLVEGRPAPYALARIPKKGETRGNIAAGGRGEGVPLTDRDRWICEQVGPVLREKGLIFVGLDVIGDFLTEINVTSPTCIRELDAEFGLNIGGDLMDAIELRVSGNAP
ncbi:MAG: glutathione synthase, partial [Gammaproteobacteria bacterium]|nr:glutathione synthase [Gammaproteobacteria bacterium]